jgi:hypothetical protein
MNALQTLLGTYSPGHCQRAIETVGRAIVCRVPRVYIDGWTVDGDTRYVWRNTADPGHRVYIRNRANHLCWIAEGKVWTVDITDPVRPTISAVSSWRGAP